ncbi:MAG: hypothetical protein IKU38_06620 [Clostridia bacterium]|nr:hypothetical protein [Clostridia bacterium]
MGTQIFLAGCAVGMPLALSSAWLASLAVVPLAGWFVRRSRCALHHAAHAGTISRAGYILLFAALLGSAVFALASLSVFAAQTLAQEAQAWWTGSMALLAAALCAPPGKPGAARLCFALRWILPALVLALSVSALPLRVPVGLFPLLGAGAVPLGAAAIAMLFGAAPALMLALRPVELTIYEPEEIAIPDTRFFLMRVLPGAAAGMLLLFLTSACTTYESIAESGEWGARLRMAAGNQPHEGIVQMLLILAKLMAMLLLCANMLSSAQQALSLAFPRLHSALAIWAICTALLATCLLGTIVLGDMPLLFGAPLIAMPAILAALLLGRRPRA